jgi:hypothetical protein
VRLAERAHGHPPHRLLAVAQRGHEQLDHLGRAAAERGEGERRLAAHLRGLVALEHLREQVIGPPPHGGELCSRLGGAVPRRCVPLAHLLRLTRSLL